MEIKSEYNYLEEIIKSSVSLSITRIFKHRDRDAVSENELRESSDEFVNNIMLEVSENFLFRENIETEDTVGVLPLTGVDMDKCLTAIKQRMDYIEEGLKKIQP